MSTQYKVVGIGELLWDILPSGKQLGGAPGNFAYMASMLGDEGIVASRVGNGPLAEETLVKMRGVGLSTEFLQLDPKHPTGTAVVQIDADGQPKFTITRDVAWDFLEWTPAWRELAERADVICFGTLAQRSAASRETIQQFLRSARTSALRIFDVNLRQNFFSSELLRDSLLNTQIVKLNHDELPVVTQLLGFPFVDEELAARQLLDTYGLKLVCITRGGNGSLLVAHSVSSSHKGFPMKVVDTVGAGDAFTACLAYHFLRGTDLDRINESANRLAAWVASQPGATPLRDEPLLKEVLAT
jgi:fructokinase